MISVLLDVEARLPAAVGRCRAAGRVHALEARAPHPCRPHQNGGRARPGRRAYLR